MKRRVLSVLLALVLMLGVLPGTALAAASWRYDSATKTLYITGTGSIEDLYIDDGYGDKSDWVGPWGKYSKEAEKLVIGTGITEIGYYAFSGFSALKSVTIPNTVKTIGFWAFQNCSSLKSITLPNSATDLSYGIFYGCSNLTNITLPDGLTAIPDNTFTKCSSLKSITIPASVTSIGSSFTFWGCDSLTDIYFGGTKAQWETISGVDDADIPTTTTIHYKNTTPDTTKTYTVSFDPNGGTVSPTFKKYIENSTFGTLPTPYRAGYEFEGWYTAKSGGNKISATQKVTAARTLYARWTKDTDRVIISFDHNDGTVASELLVVLKNTTYYSALSTPIRPGYKFDGWYTEKTGGTKITSTARATTDLTLYAHWIKNSTTPTQITVTFNPNGGKVTPTTKQYTANTTLGTLPTPTRTGYKFNGWYTARTGGTKVSTTKKVTADMTLYAQWTKNPTTTNVTITLNANGGTLSTKSLSVAKNSAYYSKLPTPTRKGYEFDGWYTTRTGGTKITSTTKATASRTIYAHWTEIVEEKDINCRVTFNPTGGTVIQKHKTVLQGTRYRDLPTPTRSGYQFLGWYTASSGGTKVSPTTKVTKTGNHTLYARWSKNAVTVRTAKDGSWTVYIPPYCRVALYASQTGLTQTSTCAPRTSEYGVKCTKTVTLSNGTQRYYGSFNGKNYWFQFSCEMDVD